MKLGACLFLSFCVACVSEPGHAADSKTQTLVFDGVCVGGKLTEKSIESISEVIAKQMNMKFKTASPDIVDGLSKGAKAAWSLAKSRDEIYIVVYSEMPFEAQVSHGCAVTVPGITLADARQQIETRYRVNKIDEGVQGFSKFLLYSADLFGFTKKMSIAIQEMSDGTPESVMTSIMFIEVPN